MKALLAITLSIFTHNAIAGYFWQNSPEEEAQRLADTVTPDLPHVLVEKGHDGNMSMVSAEAEGATLKLGYSLNFNKTKYYELLSASGVSYEYARPILVMEGTKDANRKACDSDVYGDFINDGGTVEHTHTFSNGEIDMVIAVNKASCNKYKNK